MENVMEVCVSEWFGVGDSERSGVCSVGVGEG